jgi:hypothetical protein
MNVMRFPDGAAKARTGRRRKNNNMVIKKFGWREMDI